MSKDESPKFEDVVARLEEMVERLETGGLSLDESLKVYEEGIHLAKVGNEMLEGAERRIEEIQASSTKTNGDE